MLPIRLTAGDVSGIRFAVSPLHQTVFLSLHPPRREAAATHRHHRWLMNNLGNSAEPFLQLIHADGFAVPDFVIPAPPPGRVHTLDDALDSVAAVPDWRLTEDLSPRHTLLQDGQAAKRRLTSAIHGVYRQAISEDWDAIERILHADVSKRAAQVATYGVDRMLSTLHPTVTWRSPVLTVHSMCSGPERVRNGQGIVLIPVVGRDFSVLTSVNEWEPAVLTYPALPAAALSDPAPATRSGDEDDASRALVELIGRTRTGVLLVLGAHASLSTSEVAQECGISVSSASEHASVLRRAGFIASVRRGKAVRHSITPLGLRISHAQFR
jgi:DNA-binding transcriptional ArsR family regulator